MKKVLPILVLIMVLSGAAWAVPWTWTDLWDPQDFLLSGDFSYDHNILDNGFNPGDDTVYSYALEISLYDDGDLRGECAFINLPGLVSDGFYNFNWASQSFGWSLAGWAQLNSTGLLTVTIDNWWGDYNFDYSRLEACGDETAPVPEPATLFLLGSGLLGLAGLRKRIK